MSNETKYDAKNNGFGKDGCEDGLISGVFPQHNGTFLALTYTQSKTFKTESGARRWYARKTSR